MKALQEPNGKPSSSRWLLWTFAVLVIALALHTYGHIVYGDLAWADVEGLHGWVVSVFFGSLAPYAFNRLSRIGGGE